MDGQRCRTSTSTTARTTTTTTIRQRGDGSRPVGKTNGTNSVTITVPGTQARAVSQTTQTAPGMPALTIAVATATPPNASARRTPPSHSSQPIGWRTNRVTRTAPLVTRVSEAIECAQVRRRNDDVAWLRRDRTRAQWGSGRARRASPPTPAVWSTAGGDARPRRSSWRERSMRASGERYEREGAATICDQGQETVAVRSVAPNPASLFFRTRRQVSLAVTGDDRSTFVDGPWFG